MVLGMEIAIPSFLLHRYGTWDDTAFVVAAHYLAAAFVDLFFYKDLII